MSPAVVLQLPLSATAVRRLRSGDFALLTGTLFTARDAAHRYLAEGGSLPGVLDGGVIYHCGPIVTRSEAGWRVVAAGPTTSVRQELYMARLIRRFNLRGIIGKGGMGQDTLAACRECGCAYFDAIGGAAQILAAAVKEVRGVHLLERFGAPEAVWELFVEDFPVMVTMDAHGCSLHAQVAAQSRRHLERLLALAGS